MTIQGRLTETEFYDARRLVWQPRYWLHWWNNLTWHRIGFLWIMVAILLAEIFFIPAAEAEYSAGRIAGMVAGMLLAIAGLAWKARSSDRRMLAAMQQEWPERFEIEPSGITIWAKDGDGAFVGWNAVDHWRVMRSLLLVSCKDGAAYAVPLGGVCDAEYGLFRNGEEADRRTFPCSLGRIETGGGARGDCGDGEGTICRFVSLRCTPAFGTAELGVYPRLDGGSETCLFPVKVLDSA